MVLKRRTTLKANGLQEAEVPKAHGSEEAKVPKVHGFEEAKVPKIQIHTPEEAKRLEGTWS